MDAAEGGSYDPLILALVFPFLDDHFDLLSLSQTSKFHRQFVLDSVQRITCRHLHKIEELPQNFPNMTSLKLSLVCDELTQGVFDDLMSRLPKLNALRIIRPLLFCEMKLENLSFVGKLSQLRVLTIGYAPLDDEVAELIGRGCTCLEDLFVIDPKSSDSSLTKGGWSNLVFGTRLGLRRLSVNLTILEEDLFFLFLKCSSLISLTVSSKDFRFSEAGFSNLKVEMKTLRELRLALEDVNGVDDSITNCLTDLCKKIVDSGARLEVFNCSDVHDEAIQAVCECATLSSLSLYKYYEEAFIPKLLSTNPDLKSLDIVVHAQSMHDQVMGEIAKVEVDREVESYAEMGIAPDSCLKDLYGSVHEFTSGVYVSFSSKIKFLKEFSLHLRCLSDCAEPYIGLKQLFSICTLLQTVSVGGWCSTDEHGKKLCSALRALSNCCHLENLYAPLGDNTLRRILRDVKGLRRLSIVGPVEVFSDASAFQLAAHSPFLRHFHFDPGTFAFGVTKKSGLTDKGLKALSDCEQLQILHLFTFRFDGSGLNHIAQSCLWLVFLTIDGSVSKAMMRNSRKAVQFLQNRGCHVHFA